jgi:hypothetical protein
MSTKASVTNRLDVARIEAPIDTRFPQIHSGSRSLIVEAAGQQGVGVASRPSSTPYTAGPHQSPARRCAWLDFARGRGAILATLGGTGLQAVTANLNIIFLAKPKPRDLAAKVGFVRLRARSARLRSFPAAFPT